MSTDIVAAIDVGTQAARCMFVAIDGEVLADGEESIRVSSDTLPEGWAEQDADEWWRATQVACAKAMRELSRGRGLDSTRIRAVTVDSTSGTVVPVGGEGQALRSALMYNDVRAIEETEIVQAAATDLCARLGYAFQPSFSLPKILWLRRHEPDTFADARRFLHAADYIVARLSGGAMVSDTSNALKSGYDLTVGEWPTFIADDLGIEETLLPDVHQPGSEVAQVDDAAAAATGIPTGTPIMAGCTDGTAAFLASGASLPGDVNANLGTTLVVRAVATQLIKDPLGRIYCHRHPDGWWLPGGASSSGCEIVIREFGDRARDIEKEVLDVTPTGALLYPLARVGERLPFNDAAARGFCIDKPESDAAFLGAMIEGCAYLERWTFDLLAELGGESPTRVFATGGTANSAVWLQVQADVLGMELRRPSVPQSGFGAAILAASGVHGSVSAASSAMVSPDIVVAPDDDRHERYSADYARFREACAARGYGETQQ